ncbi:MAG: response regulator [Nitrospira sp.]|nr:response regulator [Nitrospira sp.]MBS0194366.1 response regulator [Pseudomonadota bacterium]
MDVILLDDMESSRAVLRIVLEKTATAVNIHEFDNGLRALEWTRDRVPDLVVVDLSMPGISGIEFTRRFRMESRHQEVPVIMVTATDHADVRMEAHNAGVDNVLAKPFSPRVLLGLCNKLLQERAEQRYRAATTTGQYRALGLHVAQEADKLTPQAESGVYKELGRRIAEAVRGMRKG